MNELEEIREISKRIYNNIEVLERSKIPITVFEKSKDYDVVYVDGNYNTKCIILSSKKGEVLFLCYSNKEQYIESHKHPYSKKTFYVIKGSLTINDKEINRGQEFTLESDTWHELKYGEQTEVFIKLVRDEK